MWSDGQGIFLNSSQIKAGDSIKVIIYGPKGLKLNLQMYYIANNTRTVALGEDVYDDVHESSKYYDIDISNIPDANKSTLYIKLIRYSGSANLTIYADTTRSLIISLGS